MRKITGIFLPAAILAAAISCQNPASSSKQTSAGDSAVKEKPTIHNQGVPIAYTDTGRGDTTLFFVHGWCIDKSYWANQIDHFKDRYRVVAIDLPGYGESGKNRNTWTVEDFARDVDAAIAGLNLQHVILIGHSMAGDIIVEAAKNVPGKVIALVGIDNFKSVGQVTDEKSKKENDAAMQELKKHYREIATQWASQGLFSKNTDSAVRKRVLDGIRNADSVIAIASLDQPEYAEVTNLKAVRLPLFLINSDYTPTDTTGFGKNGIPFQIRYIHGSGHYPMIEQPKEFNSLLDQTLAAIH